MASKGETRSRFAQDLESIEEQIAHLEKTLERCKIMYEQYFMGIQKLPPSQPHRDVERKMLELTQIQIRNTSLRFRFNTLSQKFGVYNTYWRRTLRQIEQGTYFRDIARVKRRADRTGKDIPHEILQKMPKLMRDKIIRDRDAMARRADRNDEAAAARADKADKADRADTDTDTDTDTDRATQTVREPRKAVHEIKADDPLLGDDFDLDALFDAITETGPPKATPAATAPPPATPPKPSPTAPAARPASKVPVPRPLAAMGGLPKPPPVRPLAAKPPPTPARTSSRTTTPPQGSGTPLHPIRPQAAPRPTTLPPPLPSAAARAPSARHTVKGQPAHRHPSRKPAPVPPGRPDGTTRSAPPPPGMSETETRALLSRFNEARKVVGASGTVSYDRLMKTLNQQAPKIMKQHNAKGVSFDVVIKNDKVVLKARPKK